MPWANTGKAQRYYHDVVLGYQGDECLTWPFARGKEGYGRLARAGKICLVNRLVCTDTNGPPPTPKHEAAHSCGKGHLGCVAPRHLRWATRIENKADEVIHGVHTRGPRNGMAKLTAEQATQIRSLNGTLFLREIAELFGVSRQTVSRILIGRTYDVRWR